MDCARTADLLSAYLDGDLPETDRERVEVHLRHCRRCAGEEKALRDTISLLHDLPPLSAPPELLEGVRSRIDGERAPEPLWKKLFLPAHIKIPLEAAAVILVVMLGYGIQRDIPATRTTPPPPSSVENRESAGRPEPETRIDAAADRRKAEAGRSRHERAAERRTAKEAPGDGSGEADRHSGEREAALPAGSGKSSFRGGADLPAVPATRVSTEGGSIEPASLPREPAANEIPPLPLFAAPPSRLLKPIPNGREVILEVAPDHRAGMEERIAALAMRLGGTVQREESRSAASGASETPIHPAVVRVSLPGGSSDAFLEELGGLGTIPYVETVGTIDIPAGPVRDSVAYTIRIRVR